jgi:hypothetical protein
MKTRASSILKVLLIAAAVLVAWTAPGTGVSPAMAGEIAPSASAAVPAPAHVVRVYYFHGNARCVSCRKIEALAGESVRAAFADEMKQGKVEWLVVNVEEPSNKHFIQDYKLYTKSLVVVDLVEGTQVRWKNLERIWELLREDEAFRQYVQGEVRSYLEKRS